MCGIVGYAGARPALPFILNGLKRLEYRGYDSAGIAIIENGTLWNVKEKGKIAHLESLIEKEATEAAAAICAEAGKDSVILMGASLRHDVYRRMRGSLPMQILDETQSSVLLVKLPAEAGNDFLKTPFTCEGGRYDIVPDLEIDDFSRQRMDASDRELREEREGVADLL